MQAVVFAAPGVVQLVERPDPVPGPTDVVVQVAAAGVCGTDLHFLSGELDLPFPFTPGHEVAGEVVAVGREVRTHVVGDRVAVDPALPCHVCAACRAARDNQCTDRQGIGETRDGGCADLVLVPATNAIHLPEGVGTADAALVEPVSCAVHGLDSLGRVAEVLGARVLVVGAGTMGLLMTQLLQRVGAAAVDVVDVLPAKLEVASALGAAATATSAAELDRPQGWDVVVDATGHPAAIEDAIGRVARRGTYLQFGVAAPSARVPLSPYDLFDREIRLVGSKSFAYSFERALGLLAAGAVDTATLVSHRLPLPAYPEALTVLRSGDCRKVQVVPGLG
ncbi:alcohol dehydrogenase catalytic domain-containing protein [Angustibacter aerolatus]